MKPSASSTTEADNLDILFGAFILAEIQKTLVLGVHNLLGIR